MGGVKLYCRVQTLLLMMMNLLVCCVVFIIPLSAAVIQTNLARALQLQLKFKTVLNHVLKIFHIFLSFFLSFCCCLFLLVSQV